ncbi:MFS transporter [Kineococcus sp. DHX-1]|uniref:MFS transporter n=1 Tax=Kineococcus sp. DHX-1 TaxID=3349638 RepID=UPI0036D43970
MPGAAASPRSRSLLRERDIARVWTAGLVVWVGNYALFVVLPFVVYQGTSSPLATAITVLGGAVPPVLVGQLAGVLADRWDRRSVLIGANAVLAALTVGYLLIDASAWGWLAVLTFARSCAGQLVGPAESALLPDLAPAQRLEEAAALNTLNNTLGRLVGPALGGTLFAAGGLPAAATLVVLCHLGAAVTLSTVAQGRSQREAHSGPGLLRQWREGAVLTWREPVLRALLPLMLVMAVGEGFVSALLAPFASDLLEAGADAVGWILSAQAVGGIVGAWWCTRSLGRRDPMRLLALAALIAGVLLVLTFGYPLLDPVLWPAVVLTAVAGAPFAVVAAAQGLLLQRHAAPAARGRVFALCWGLSSLVQIVAIGAAGVLAQRVGSLVIMVDAVAYVVVGAMGLAASSRLRRAVAGRPAVEVDDAPG